MLELIGALDKASSTKKINSDIKELQKSINMLRVTATLMKGDSKKSINQVIQQMEGQLRHVKLQTKIDQKNLKSDIDKALNGTSFKDIDVINIDENKAKLKIRKVIADTKAYVEKTPITINIEAKKSKLMNDLTSYLNKNTKIKESSVLLDEADKVRKLIDAIGDKKTLRDATDAFQLYKSEVSATGFNTKSTSDKIKGMLSNVTKIGSMFGVASMAVGKFQESLTTIKNNNNITTEISKTSEMTKKQLEELGDEAFRVASKYGQTSGNYLLGVQEMARSGYETLSKELGELSLLTQSAGDMTADSANNYLLATDAAYKYSGSVEKLNAALDGANYISNKNSASLTDIADATSVSASFAANAGVAIDELTAAEATMIAVTKRSGSEIGRAFRSIVLNLQQVSGEFDGEVIDEEQLKKVEDRCHSLGVELEYMNNGVPTLRNTMDVLRDLANVYNSLPDNSADKQGLIADIAGKYHANSLTALLSRWDLYEKMLGEYSQGTGSALEEAEKTANSLEGRLNALQNSWDSLVNSMTNKSLIKGGISFFDGILQSAQKLTEVFDVFPVVTAGLTAGMTALNKDVGINQIFNKDGEFDIQGNLFGIIDFTQMNHFKDAGKAIEKWNAELRTGQVDINDFGEDVVKNTAQLKEYLSTCSVDAPASLEGYKQSLQKAGVATNSLRVGTILLNTALSAGIAFAIQSITTAIIDFATASSKIQESAKEIGASINSTKSDIENYKTRIKELQDTIHDSSSSISDITEARKNLMSIQSELIEKYGSEVETIHIVTDAINDQADALDKLSEKSYKEEKNKFNKSGFFENLSNNINGYSSNMNKMIAEMEAPLTLNLVRAANRNMEEYKKFEKIISQYGTIGTGSKSLGGNGQEALTIELSGGLDSIYEKLLKIQNTASNYDFGSDDFNKMLTNKINEIKEKLDSYSELYDNYVLYDKILSNSGKVKGYDKVFKNLIDSYNRYMDVIASGDESKIEQAQSDYAKLFTESMKQIDDESVITYFENMYPELQEVIGKWQFKLDFSNNTKNIQKDVQDAVDKLNKDGFTVETLVDFQSETATDEQIQNYSILEAIATNCKMDIIELIELLEEMGLVQSDSYKQLVSQFGEENVKTLSDEDLQIAYTIEASGNMTFEQFLREIENIKKAAEEAEENLSPSDKFQNLWDSEDFADTREEIEKLAKQGKLTAEEIESLAKENSDLNDILEDVSISSQFAARCFELVCNGADGFSNITESTLALDRALHDMDDVLLSAADAKSKYDEAMSKDDYNTEFKNYQEAYTTAMESFKNGEYGKQFRASMEYLLGEDSYSMSIEELYKSVKKLGSIFGEEANNGLEFLDKLYANKEILDGLDSTLKKTSDGGYDFDIKTDDFDNIAEALGMTTEEVTACVNALGMFGDYSSYDIEKVKEALDDMAISVSKTGKTTLSLQGLENVLSDLGYEGYEAYQILEKLRSQDDIKLLDFNISDGKNASKELVDIIDKLKELGAIDIDYTSAVNTSALIENMSAFGISSEQISEFLNKINELTTYHLDVSNLDGLESIQAYVNEILGNTDKSSTESMSELAEEEDNAKTKAEDLTDALHKVNDSSMLNVLSGIKNVFDALSKTNDKAETTQKNLKNLFDTNISFPTVSDSDTSNNSSGKTTSGKKKSTKKAKADGTVAYAGGTNVTLGRDQEAVVNELGNESIVRNGVWSEIPGGTHIEKLKKGDIIFNHKQTEELKKNGRVTSNGGHGKVIGAFPSGTVPGVNPATKKEWSSGSKSSSSSSSKSNSSSGSTKEKTALEKFQEWISKLFDWIEIKIQRQSEKIDKYITKAGNAKDSGSYGTSATNYRRAINATTTQITYEQKAATKYNDQADKVVKKAVSMGVVSQKQANSIKKQVQNGSINIKKYSDKIQEVIGDYQTWYEKSKTASKAVTELHNNIRTYIQDLKDMRDAQRDAKLSTIDTYTSIGTSGVANTKTVKNNQLKYTNNRLAAQNSAYATETAKVSSDTTALGKTGKTAVTKALKTKDAKGKSKNAKAYKKALNNAKKAINAKTAVSSADLKTIRSHSVSVYNKLYAYNLALDNLETAKLEQAANYAATSSEIYQNIAEIYNNKDDSTYDEISLLQQQASNPVSAVTANGYLDKVASKYDTILKNDNAEIAEYESAVTSNTKTISNKAGTTAKYKKLDTATKTKVKKAVDNAKSAAKNGKAIAAATLSNLAKYYSQGYVTAAFYQSCMDYNNALESKEQAEAQLEIDEQTAIQEKASIGTEKLNNIEQEYTNKQNTVSSDKNRESINQSIKTTKGFELDKSDYQTMLDYSKQELQLYEDEIDSLSKTIQENLDSGYWTEESQECINARNSVSDYEKQVLECQKEQEEWNNEIAQFPYTVFEKANNLLQSMKSKFQSLLDIKTTRGLDKTEQDILEEKDILDKQRREKEDEIEQLKRDYQSALDAGGAYGGNTADEWLVKINEAETELNGLIKTDEELNNEIAQLPYDVYEKELSLLDSIATYNKSITDLTKAQGRDLSEDDYLMQIGDNESKIQKYEKERIQAYKDYKKALAAPDGVYGGKTVNEWLSQYHELGSTINNLKADNEDIRDALRDDVYWRTFERTHKAAQALRDVLSGIGDLIDDTMLYDKDGKFTDFGVAQMANSIKQYETAREEVQNYTDDIQNLNSLYAQGYYNQDEFNEKLSELQSGLFESASSMKSYISEIIDMNKNLAQSELDNLFKLIDARNEALSAKKNYYEFDSTIKSKTKDIQSLEAQIAALNGVKFAPILFNCWKTLKTIKPQRKDETNLNVMVVKTEKINCMRARSNPLLFF